MSFYQRPDTQKWNNESLTTSEAQLLLDHLYTIYHLVVNLQWHSPPPIITITEYDSKHAYRTKTLQLNGFAVLHHGDHITTENDPTITKHTFGHDSLMILPFSFQPLFLVTKRNMIYVTHTTHVLDKTRIQFLSRRAILPEGNACTTTQ
jgi:hypothetical protein